MTIATGDPAIQPHHPISSCRDSSSPTSPKVRAHGNNSVPHHTPLKTTHNDVNFPLDISVYYFG
jgi:hypothetical protein